MTNRRQSHPPSWPGTTAAPGPLKCQRFRCDPIALGARPSPAPWSMESPCCRPRALTRRGAMPRPSPIPRMCMNPGLSTQAHVFFVSSCPRVRHSPASQPTGSPNGTLSKPTIRTARAPTGQPQGSPGQRPGCSPDPTRRALKGRPPCGMSSRTMVCSVLSGTRGVARGWRVSSRWRSRAMQGIACSGPSRETKAGHVKASHARIRDSGTALPSACVSGAMEGRIASRIAFQVFLRSPGVARRDGLLPPWDIHPPRETTRTTGRIGPA